MLFDDPRRIAGLRARARGAYLGLAIGDALGATVEFMTPGEIRTVYGEHRFLTGGGWLRLKPGQVTDDTDMSLALGDAIVDSGGWNLRAVADHYLAWMRSKPVDIGNTCRRGIMRYLRDGSLESPFHEGDAGNGAAMRNLPVAVYTLGDAAEFERCTLEQCHVTHNHPLSDAATLAFGGMLQALLAGEEIAACRAIAADLVARNRTFRFDPYPKRATGYVVDTVQTVCHCFFSTRSFEECLVKTVNLGGDADTNGAIAGSLAGAFYGEQAIPNAWLRRLDKRSRARIEAQVDGLLALASRRG